MDYTEEGENITYPLDGKSLRQRINETREMLNRYERMYEGYLLRDRINSDGPPNIRGYTRGGDGHKSGYLE